MSFLSYPIYTDSPLMVSATPSVVVTSNVKRPYSQDYRTYEFPSMLSPIMSPTLIVDTPYITDAVPMYSDTSIYGNPVYNSPHMVSSYDSPLVVASPTYVTGISTESDFITPGVIDVKSPYDNPYDSPYNSPYNNPYNSPYMSTVDLSYSQPLVGVYENISYNYEKATTDPEITNKYVKHFYYKVLDKWLYDELSDLLNYFTVSGGSVKLAGSYKSSNYDNFKSTDVDNISKYIGQNLLTKADMTHLLHKLIKRQMGLTWSGLARNERMVMKAVKKFLKSKLEKKVR